MLESCKIIPFFTFATNMYLLSCLFNLCFISYKQFHFFCLRHWELLQH